MASLSNDERISSTLNCRESFIRVGVPTEKLHPAEEAGHAVRSGRAAIATSALCSFGGSLVLPFLDAFAN